MNIYERLNKILASISDPDFDGSLETLSTHLGIPSKQITNDLITLKRNKYTKELFNLNEEESNKANIEPFTRILEEISKKEEIIPTKRTKGLLKRYHSKDAKLCPVNKIEARQFVFLDPYTYMDNSDNNTWDQEDLINSLKGKSVYGKTGGQFLIKSTTGQNQSYDPDIIRKIRGCINGGKSILVDNQEFTPHFIKMDMNTKQLYAIEAYLDLFVNDKGQIEERIVAEAICLNKIDETCFDQLTVDKTKANIKDDEAVIQYINSLWSFEYENLEDNSQQTPTHIKIHIYNGTGNIIEKLKKDISNRKYASLTGPFTCPGYIDLEGELTEFYIYEDDIIGIQAFKRWLYQYGRSMIVMEPKELAYEIYNELGVDI